MSADASNHSRLLTPPGTGAIGVIRIAGPDAARIIGRVFRPANQSGRLSAGLLDSYWGHRRLRYGHLVDAGEVIDDVIVTRTSEGEHAVFDICAHGGVRVVERIVDLFDREGAPLRSKNESVAPVWPQKNMIECEAVEAMQIAKTERCVHFLAWQRQHLVSKLDALSACDDCVSNQQALQTMIGRYRSARWLIDGATLVIVGPPNSGKSTLFNRLMGRSAAIVSQEAGTTRDWVAEPIELGGVPITLVDTAGRHDTVDRLERDAIKRGVSFDQRADIRILMLDGSELFAPVNRNMVGGPDRQLADIVVVNKSDLRSAWSTQDLLDCVGQGQAAPLLISASHGEGVGELEKSVLRVLGLRNDTDESPAIFTPRQFDVANKALAACRKATSADFAHAVDRLVGIFSDAEGDIGYHRA